MPEPTRLFERLCAFLEKEDASTEEQINTLAAAIVFAITSCCNTHEEAATVLTTVVKNLEIGITTMMPRDKSKLDA